MDRDDVLEFIKTAKPTDLLQIFDALIDPVSDYLGMCVGVEDTRHDLLMQIEKD